jgi:hypothetical protein
VPIYSAPVFLLSGARQFAPTGVSLTRSSLHPRVAMSSNGSNQTKDVQVMKAILFALLVIIVSTRAADAWEGNFRRCDVSFQFSQGILTLTAGQKGIDLDIRSKSTEEVGEPKPSISSMRKALDFLQKCDKFWTCVADRDLSPHPKHKHCFLPRDIR